MYKFITLICLFYNTISTAQQIEPISPDRPDQTESPVITAKKYIQAEIGFNYESTGSHSYSILLPTTLLRYGVTERFELRLETEIEQTKDSLKNTGLNPVGIGFKTKLIDEKGWIPMIAFLGNLNLAHVAARHNQTDFYAPSFKLAFQHTLSPKVDLGYNLGAEWDGFTAEPTFIYTLTTGYSISEKFGSFIELYGFLPQKNSPDHHIDCGLTYLLNNNAMLDISGGLNLSKHSPGYFAALGFSFRFK